MELEFIVDTGAIYTVIPRGVAEKLRLKEWGRRKFKTAAVGCYDLGVNTIDVATSAEWVSKNKTRD